MTTVTGPVAYQLDEPPFAVRVQLIVDLLEAIDWLAVQLNVKYLPSYDEVLTPPLLAILILLLRLFRLHCYRYLKYR